MKYPNLYNIAFSDNRSNRRKRHFLFWLAVYLYHIVRIGLMLPAVDNLHALWTLLEFSLFRGVIPNILFTYSIVYYLIPRFFNRKKYISFITGMLVSIALLQFYGRLNEIFHSGGVIPAAISQPSYYFSGSFWSHVFSGPVWSPGFIRLFGNPPLICGLFLSLKILKSWHHEQQKTAVLAKENTHAELQLLKAQVHPHFLFNTLNNIYSFTLNQSPLAGTLVQKLSDMLNYMIHECEKPLVPLEKEIKLIRDYIGLEKVRYGNRLDMQVEIKGEYNNKMIAPLLMIPFVENCFKHGASAMRGQQWIKLNISYNENELDFNIGNSKPLVINGTNNKKGIGLTNVQKRLQLIYPDQHDLVITETPDSYFVQLKIELKEQGSLNTKQINPVLAYEYAAV